MKYSLEAVVEGERLEEQVFQTNYSLVDEFKDIDFKKGEVVMDAGCGTGVLSRFILARYPIARIEACDFSDLRLKQASDLLNEEQKKRIHFSRQDLRALDPALYGKFDTVVCRYVIEHMDQPFQIIQELKKALKPGGRLVIIELDGVFINLFTANEKLNQHLADLKRKVKFDLEIGRKVPAMFKKAGMKEIEWESTLLTCRGNSLQEEKANTEKRFIAIRPFMTEFFGSEKNMQEFERLYLEEMVKPESTLVFTKYIVIGRK